MSAVRTSAWPAESATKLWRRNGSVFAGLSLLLAGAAGFADEAPPESAEFGAATSTIDAPIEESSNFGEAGLHDDPYAMLDDEAFADADAELLSLDLGTVVTAARREQHICDVPYAISVVTADDIRRSGARSIPDALRLVPGVDVADLNYGQSTLQPRGFAGYLSRETLVLVDGRQVFDSFFGGTTWGAWPFMLEDIERIEVIRGPGGVTWGANAVNGVVNIITKDPREQLGLTVRVGGGNRGVHREYVGYAFAGDDFRIRVSGEYESSEGFNHGGHFLRPLEDEYRTGRFAVYGVFDLSERDSFTLSAGNGLTDGGYPPAVAAGIHTGPSGTQANFALFRLSRTVEQDNSFDLTLYVNDEEVRPGLIEAEYRYQNIALQFGQCFKPHPDHTVSYGIDTRVDLFDGRVAQPQITSHPYITTGVIGLFAQDEWRFAPRWTFSLGGRIDYETYGGFEPSGSAALAYQIDDHSLVYGNISRAFQMPPASFRYLDTAFLDGLLTVTTDAEIDATKTWAYELGYRTLLFERLHLAANAYYHERYEITTASPRFDLPHLLHIDIDNRANSAGYGVELEARYLVNDQLTLLGHYTYEDFTFDSPQDALFTDRMIPPRNKFMLGARCSPTEDLHLASHLYFVDRTRAPGQLYPFEVLEIDPYFRLDLNAEWEFWEDRASLSVGVKNLLDDQHYEGGSQYINAAEVPRMYYAQLRIHLD